jgi:hypothetical protein
MKQLFTKGLVSLALVGSLVVPSLASANLIDVGNGFLYETHLDVTFLKDADTFPNMLGHAAAVTFAANLDFKGFDDWRLPTLAELYNHITADTSGIFVHQPDPFINLDGHKRWTSTFSHTFAGNPYYWTFDFDNGGACAGPPSSEGCHIAEVMPVRDGYPVIPTPDPPNPIPEPSTILLWYC